MVYLQILSLHLPMDYVLWYCFLFMRFSAFYTFDMLQLGSMLMISFYYFRNRLQQSNLHWLSSYYEPSVHLFLGRSWNSIRPLTGMDGPSTQVQWLHNSLSRTKRKSILITAVLQSPSRKNLEKIIGILLWATSLVHHVRFLYWPPCTETFTLSQWQTTASNQQIGNHS